MAETDVQTQESVIKALDWLRSVAGLTTRILIWSLLIFLVIWAFRVSFPDFFYVPVTFPESNKPHGIKKDTEFSASLTPVDNHLVNGAILNLEAQILPGAAPAGTCYGIIQVVRLQKIIGPNEFQNLYGSIERKARATSTGWYVDRIDDAGTPFFGLEAGGTIGIQSMNPATIKIGYVDSISTQIMDRADRREISKYLGVRWEAIAATVSLTDRSKDMGHYYWSWTVDNDGNVIGLQDEYANSELVDEFERALAKWNEKKGNGVLATSCK